MLAEINWNFRVKKILEQEIQVSRTRVSTTIKMSTGPINVLEIKKLGENSPSYQALRSRRD